MLTITVGIMVLLLKYVDISCQSLITMTRTNAVPTVPGVFLVSFARRSQENRICKVLSRCCTYLGTLRTRQETPSCPRPYYEVWNEIRKFFNGCLEKPTRNLPQIVGTAFVRVIITTNTRT